MKLSPAIAFGRGQLHVPLVATLKFFYTPKRIRYKMALIVPFSSTRRTIYTKSFFLITSKIRTWAHLKQRLYKLSKKRKKKKIKGGKELKQKVGKQSGLKS